MSVYTYVWWYCLMCLHMSCVYFHMCVLLCSDLIIFVNLVYRCGNVMFTNLHHCLFITCLCVSESIKLIMWVSLLQHSYSNARFEDPERLFWSWLSLPDAAVCGGRGCSCLTFFPPLCEGGISSWGRGSLLKKNSPTDVSSPVCDSHSKWLPPLW